MSERAGSKSEKRPSVRTEPLLQTSPGTILLAAGFIVLATLAAYHNCFSVPFLYDDEQAIKENLTIRRLWPIGPVLSPPVGGITVSGRPLVNLSLALNYALSGTAVWSYHAVNLAIHILASLTLFGIVRRTFWLNPGLRQRFGSAALFLAFSIALLWAVHPLQTEAVTYVVQRAEALMGLLYLLTIYGFLRGTQSGTVGWYVLTIGACMLGMATKEVMVSAPLIVLLYDRTFVAGTLREALRQRWRVYVGLSSSWLLLAFLVFKAGELGSQRAGFHAEVGWWPYALTQCWAIAHYLWLSVWPHSLVFDYGTLLVTSAAQAVPSALLDLLLAAGVVASLRRWPALGFAGCWFFLILAPTSSVMPLAGQTVAEHRMYLPLAAVVMVMVLGIYARLGRWSLILFLSLTVALGFMTAQRNRDYRSSVSIWSDTAAKRPDNARAHNNLGEALLSSGRVQEGTVQFQEALELQPNYAPAHNNLGNILLGKGQVAEASAHFQRAVELQPDNIEARNNLGNVLLLQGRVDESIDSFRSALRIRPDNADAQNNLGTALLQKGLADEAITHFQRALQIQPEDAIAHNNLGNLLLQKGLANEALVHFQKALESNPNSAETHYNIANALIQKGLLDEAIVHYQMALATNPRYAEAHNNLGNALVQKGRVDEAVPHFIEALRLRPDYAEPKEQLRALGALKSD